jgi:hypothetical protein
VLAPTVAACGSKNGDAQRALDRFNGGYAPVRLRETVERGRGVRVCRIGPQPGRSGYMLLTVLTTNDRWLQATIDPGQTLAIADVTTGASYTDSFGAQAVRELRERGDACKVSAAEGTLSLD